MKEMIIGVIENGKVVKSVWDDVSVEIHDENPDRIYYRSEYEAQMALPIDAIEISPILALDEDNETTTYNKAVGFEVTDEGDPDIVAWGVYAHRTGVGATNLFDVVDKKNAEQAEKVLRKLYNL